MHRKTMNLIHTGRKAEVRHAACHFAGFFTIAMLLGTGGCNNNSNNDVDIIVQADQPGFDWHLPQGFPTPKMPSNNPMSEAKVELGRFLFYDRRMSINETLSCADCHLQSKAFTDGKTTSTGALGDLHPRNAMSMTNVVYNASQNWANPVTLTLHSQALVPMFGETPVELGWSDHDAEILGRFEQDPDYPQRFAKAFPKSQSPITADNVAKAVSAFGATLISGNSDFDRSAYQGQKDALSDAAKRGLDLFFTERLDCFHCHGGFNFASAVDHQGIAFEQVEFHNNGLYNIDGDGAYPAGNQGLFDITANLEDRGKFKAPTLRNIELTAPYMHDGSIATLGQVIDHYSRGGRLIESGPNAGDGAKNPIKSSLIGSFQITALEKQDLIEFFKSLTDWGFICDPRFSDPFGNIHPHPKCL